MSSWKRSLTIEAKAWIEGSCELFNYETLVYETQTFQFPDEKKHKQDSKESQPPLLHLKTTKHKEAKCGSVKDSCSTIARIYENAAGIQITPFVTSVDQEKTIWRVAPRINSVNGYTLKCGDIIKLGKTVLKVLEIKITTNLNRSRDTSRSQTLLRNSISSYIENFNKEEAESLLLRESGAEDLCKICFYGQNGDNNNNPLISPCACTGSIRHVHLVCLQKWIWSKLNVRQKNNVTIVLWKSIKCEICHSELPLCFKHNDENLNLIPVFNPLTTSYVILETYSKPDEAHEIYIVDLTYNKTFKIGRSRESDLQIYDISISRLHAFLGIDKGKLCMKDNFSKFGSLILAREPIFVSDEISRSPLLQCGSLIFEVTVKRPWIRFLPCMSFQSWGNESTKGWRVDLMVDDHKAEKDKSLRRWNTNDLP